MYEILEGHGVIPVVQLENSVDALPLADALSAGGVNIMEITFRSDAAEESIKEVAENRPDILVGAGTVTTMDHLDRAIKAGAKFIVSPGIYEPIVNECLKRNVLPLPGVVTPSEIIEGINLGLEVLKFFPASTFGGLKTLQAYKGVFKEVKFLPTGGIGPDNLADYLEEENVLACGGSWMCKPQLVKEGEWDEITRICKEAREIYEGVRGK